MGVGWISGAPSRKDSFPFLMRACRSVGKASEAEEVGLRWLDICWDSWPWRGLQVSQQVSQQVTVVST